MGVYLGFVKKYVLGKTVNFFYCLTGLYSFSRLSGFLNPEKNEHSLLLKWRFTVSENSVDMLMPWNYCYKGQECSGNIPPVVPVIPFIQLKPPAEEPVSYLICRYPENVAYLDSNLDFVVGVGSKENKSLDNIILQGMIKPTPGVKLQVISMDEANTINPEATYITAENPGVFTYHLSQIAPRSQIVRHIIVKLIKAPSGTSLVEYTAKLFGGNEESYNEKGITTLNITPVINKGELQLKILASLVREEAGIAEILRSQAEKIEKGLSLATDISSIIRVDESIQDTLKTLIKYHILQEFKLEEALKMDKGS
jgi:hypothetical protein